MMNRLKRWAIGLILLCYASKASGQGIIRIPLEKEHLRAMNRKIKLFSDSSKGSLVQVRAMPKPGIIWIKGLHFKIGAIEFDVKGRDALQESFVGVAFHGKNDNSYEAVYFRPFNFNAKDRVRKSHAIQYMAIPKYDWPFLRENFNGKYEAPTKSFIDPNNWFHVKVVVSEKLISVFINGEKKPSLEIPPLQKPINGNVGFWLGDGSDGAFTNLVITGGQWFKK